MKIFNVPILLIVGIWISVAKCQSTTKEKLNKLRNLMRQEGYSACVIPRDDEHLSEYVAAYDKRRAWLSDFTGSAGTAVVTLDEAALWTDSRYYLQAENQLDPIWILMKASEPDTLKIETWLRSKLSADAKVAMNARFSSVSTWQNMENELKKSDISLVSPDRDLIDLIWTEGRPQKPNTDIYIHNITFTGLTWKQKVDQVKEKIKDSSADYFVVTALDETAWLFNLRASDLPNNPMFFSYAIISGNNEPHRLYINPGRINTNLQEYLDGVVMRNYTDILDDIRTDSLKGYKIWVAPQSSYAIYSSVSDKNVMINKASPIRSLKARKNDVELKNLRKCHIRDSVARIRHMYWLENELEKGTVITEKTSAAKLEEIQKEDPYFVMKSFNSISAVGKNAAIVHYSTEEGEDSILTKDKIYLLDAGGNYLDCTSDITRTHFYGTVPSAIKDAYTRVLQGSINLASIVFPPGVYGRELDVEARSALWKVGLDYGHGTGHGIGYFLSVHENPPTTSYSSRSAYDETFVPGMIQSDEPGYYEDGYYGIRLETDIVTVEAKTEFNFRGRQYLTFESLNFVPFEKNLINKCLLTNDQVDWLNLYNKQTRDHVLPRLEKFPEVREYLLMKTEPFQYSHAYKDCSSYIIQKNGSLLLKHFGNSILVLMMILSLFFRF
ncbi:unnamed protein product [Brachionus calyciflorus]|uniref:Xaa-Pro aminopeptidase 1 n=1 Tax=Brachionus calyciflorus TaxID=104777 RepID=A0A813RPA9_9BILA|nr:unnamed protein product [Brachionus calyciflorus]